MSKHWLEANTSRLMAEILRDFCVVSITLEEQFVRFDSAGNLSYAVLREMLGAQMSKGTLWRLKDTAHHLLRDAPASPVSARLLDWAIGYLFHEGLKLLESTHQDQYYTPVIIALAEDNPSPELECIARDFSLVAEENKADMGCLINRIRRLLAHARLFFHRCYAGHDANKDIARLLNDRESLVREAFGEEYDRLVAAIYGNSPHTLFINAALSLHESGKNEEANKALFRAKNLAPESTRVLALTEMFTAHSLN